MTHGSGRKHSLRIASLVAVALVAGIFLVSAAPDEAAAFKALFTAKHLADAEKDRKGLKKFFGDIIDRAGEGLSGVIAGDDSAPDRALQGQREALGRLLVHKIDPTHGGATSLYNKLKSAKDKIKDKIKSVVGRAADTVSDARTEALGHAKTAAHTVGTLLVPEASADTLIDRRGALAVTAKDRALYESGTGILGDRPLPTPASAKTSPAESPLQAKFKEWARWHEEYPHCWGIVDANSDPERCMAKADDARRRAAAEAAKKPKPEKADDGKIDWASDNWKAEGTGWAGWDRSDSRYDDADRDAARVGIYAWECWGAPGVTADSGLYDLMKGRMARNECPEKERGQDQGDEGDQGKGSYEAALADRLGDDGAETAAEGDSYRDALSALDAQDEPAQHGAGADDVYQAALGNLEARNDELRDIESGEISEARLEGDHDGQSELSARLPDTQCSADIRQNCWIEFLDSPGCGFFVGEGRTAIESYISNWHYDESQFNDGNIKIDWFGACADGIAIGQGIISGYRTIPIGGFKGCDGNQVVKIAIAGQIHDDGRKDGRWTLSVSRSSEEMCSYHEIGLDRVTSSVEMTVEQIYLNGKEHGAYSHLSRSTATSPNGRETHTTEENGSFINGMKDGVWLTRDESLWDQFGSQHFCFRVEYSQGEELSRQEC